MEIRSELDEYVDQPPENTHTYDPEKVWKPPKKKKKWGWLIILLAVLGIGSCVVSMSEDGQDYYSGPGETEQQISLTESGFSEDGDTVYLARNGQNSFSFSSEQFADKTLVWDRDADSYYDADSSCWLWCNVDVDPPVWQYWYEGISSDFGDFGWMEHDSDGWFIEASEGNWIAVPGKYDVSGLWYID